MPRGSLASKSRRSFGSQQAKANMPRSQLTASGPCSPIARSMTAVSPVEWNSCLSATGEVVPIV